MTEIIIQDDKVIELATPGVVIFQGGGGGSGTVTTVSFSNANGFAGTVTNPTTTPNITVSTTVTGLLKGNGTAVSAAVAGTDYLTPTGSAAGLTGLTSLQVTTALGFTPGTGNGTVTSFAFTNGSGFTGTVNTSTTTPTLSLSLQNASATQSGQLTSTDWNTFNSKGSGTVTSFAFTNANGVTGTVSTASTTPTLSLSIQTASASQDGLLSSTDWSTFNSKGSGSVTTLSVASLNGFAGTVANPSTTPTITLTTSASGILKGSAGALVAATAGTDYLLPTGSAAQLTGLLSSQVTTALGFTPYNSTNPSGYISGNQTITFTGDATGSGTTAVTLTIPSGTVTFAKMQTISTGVLLGRSTAGTGAPETISIGSGLSLSGGSLSATGGGTGTVTSFTFTNSGGFTGTVTNSTTTPTLSLVLQTASGSQSGQLSSTDWTTFNNKGSGSVTSFTFTNANGFAGTVTNSTTTPTLSMSYTVPAAGETFTNNAYNAEPSTPSSGFGKFYTKTVTAVSQPKFIDDFGINYILSPSLGDKKIRGMIVGGDGAGTPNIVYFGLSTYSVTGTATTRSPATTSFYTRCARIGYVSASTAGSLAGPRGGSALVTVGDGAGLGGFRRVIRFGCSDAATVSGARQFVGLRNSTSAPTNVDPSTYTNVIGIGHADTDTNLKIYYGGSAAQTPIDLGSNFPANTLSTDAYELRLYAPSNSNNTVYYYVKRLNTSFEASGTLTGTAGTALPSSTNLLNHMYAWRCNNATALAVGLDIFLDYLETDY